MDTEKPELIFLKIGSIMSFVNACPAQGIHDCKLEAVLPLIYPSSLVIPPRPLGAGEGDPVTFNYWALLSLAPGLLVPKGWADLEKDFLRKHQEGLVPS